LAAYDIRRSIRVSCNLRHLGWRRIAKQVQKALRDLPEQPALTGNPAAVARQDCDRERKAQKVKAWSDAVMLVEDLAKGLHRDT
jgi:hypothetical protein